MDNGFNPESMGAMETGFVMAAMGIGLLIGLIVGIVIAYLLSSALQRLPEEHRAIEPWYPWLLLIPFFNLIWNFFVFPKVSQSYCAYFDSLGDDSPTDSQDCGEQLGWWYCGLCVASLVPCIGGIAGIAALVILILYLIKIGEFKNMIPETPGFM